MENMIPLLFGWWPLTGIFQSLALSSATAAAAST